MKLKYLLLSLLPAMAYGQSFAYWSSPAETLLSTVTAPAVVGKIHTIECISFGAVNLEPLILLPPYDTMRNLSVIIRDGDSGVGAILRVWRFTVNASTTGVMIPLRTECGLNIKGTMGNSMTIEFNSAVSNLEETVNFNGHLE